MTRLHTLSLFALVACGSPEEPADAEKDSSDYYESSGTVFLIDPEELPDVEREALAGDDEQLQRLIDYYAFSHVPQDPAAGVALQRWQLLGSTRGLKGAMHNLVYSASEARGPDCSAIRKYAKKIPSEDLDAIRDENNYVQTCLSEG